MARDEVLTMLLVFPGETVLAFPGVVHASLGRIKADILQSRTGLGVSKGDFTACVIKMQFLCTCSQEISSFRILPWLVWLRGLTAGVRKKGRQFDSQSRHMPGLWARSPVGGT